MADKQNLSESSDFLDEKLCNALAVLVKNTELRLGQSSAVYTFEYNGEKWVVAVTRIAGKG